MLLKAREYNPLTLLLPYNFFPQSPLYESVKMGLLMVKEVNLYLCTVGHVLATRAENQKK